MKTGEIKNMTNNKFMKYGLYSMIFIFTVILTACGSEEVEVSKSMEELQREQGIPVEVAKVKKEKFEKFLTYFSSVSGKRQTTEGAMVGGRVKAVNAKPGQFVKKDAVIVEFPDDLPGSQIQQAKASFENAEKTYKRMKALFDAGETSRQNFDNAETQFVVAKRNYESVKQTLLVDAPYDGVITEVKVNVGDAKKAGDPLFTIANLSKMKARIWATSEEIDLIKVGDKAYAKYNGYQFTGTVVEKAMAIDPAKQAFYVEIVFNNADGKLRAGTTVEISIKIYDNETVVVPSHLLKNDVNGKYVFVEEGNKANKVYVKTGEQSGADVEVLDGLKQGMNLVTKGGSSLSAGVKLNVVK